MEVAGVVAVVLLGVVSVFQVALALGAPFGRAAWGGTHSLALPAKLRVVSGVAGIALYPYIIWLVLASSGLVRAREVPASSEIGMWILTGFFTIGAVANFASRSPIERIWGPVSLTIGVCCGIIAVGMT